MRSGGLSLSHALSAPPSVRRAIQATRPVECGPDPRTVLCGRAALSSMAQLNCGPDSDTCQCHLSKSMHLSRLDERWPCQLRDTDSDPISVRRGAGGATADTSRPAPSVGWVLVARLGSGSLPCRPARSACTFHIAPLSFHMYTWTWVTATTCSMYMYMYMHAHVIVGRGRLLGSHQVGARGAPGVPPQAAVEAVPPRAASISALVQPTRLTACPAAAPRPAARNALMCASRSLSDGLERRSRSSPTAAPPASQICLGLGRG